ncbi:diguanylate cyclase (GGDEF) domain-containing protein [Janthinobacterium psychrotolerans]|uniref:diguanylate cyclase n=1 Tax=Janthinobacterium psychrotolerans TaxID=1747903 RepID=A0A1A7C0A6_9BURK|nr:diguanylate cyclase (GGDEF) domain-containing protein [Janthinobacterium psychrotolerans]
MMSTYRRLRGLVSGKHIVEKIGNFGASGCNISDLQLFCAAADDTTAAMLAPCPVLRLEAGEALSDASGACLYIVLRGSLAVATDTHTGMDDGTVSKVLPGESVGEQSVLDEASNLVAISALEETDVLVIDAVLVWELIEQSNGLARNLLRLMSFRVRAANALLRRRQKLGEFYRQLSMVDSLTGLYNRAWLNDLLPNMITTAHDSDAPLSLVMIDLDHFKRFNDQHGHQAGDQALRIAAQVLGAALRPTDFAVRYGGEELMVILPDTHQPMALLVAERLCERLRQAVIFEDLRCPLPHVTGSFGVASLLPRQQEHDLIATADAALYRAKDAGRNRVAV